MFNLIVGCLGFQKLLPAASSSSGDDRICGKVCKQFGLLAGLRDGSKLA